MAGRTIFQLGLVLTLAAGLASAQLRGRGENAAGHGWLSSLSQGKERARAAGKPLMVVIRCFP